MRRITLLISLLAVLAACSSTGTPSEELDITGNWQLVSGTVDGQAIPLIDGSPVTLNVTGTEIGGTSACNSYGGQFILDGSSISIGDLVTTLMMCTPDVMAVETPYTTALPEVDAVAIDGDRLILTGPGVELTFAPAA
jgi:heat shock protein HslJ